ncbi:molybdenum cofactor synthesis domain-containing protein [Orenia metallireducens]|uniref:Molybdenum cofactor synthesis domain-containing protein n=1 Tax=Orenia metallireducens TaxID=1413210 RepID=A0A285GGF2_9FIRM|nr:molybdenum cofactor synthesis domain-containing protein [Orenia metallireducens]SNY22649.1 molybdenum cofactor synthesis domain-containing protein [Orenia metallireducens]
MESDYTVGIITASDKGFKGERIDESVQVIREILEGRSYQVARYTLLPDNEKKIYQELVYMSDELNLNLILTTGGTGFSKRDVTPEATRRVVERLAPGISEAIRAYSLKITPRAMLSRAIAGIRNETLIINLPGSPKAVRESLEYIIDTLDHGLEILLGYAGDCARD